MYSTFDEPMCGSAQEPTAIPEPMELAQQVDLIEFALELAEVVRLVGLAAGKTD